MCIYACIYVHYDYLCRYYSKPSQKDREVNVEAAFKFMTDVEKIPLSDIGKTRIVGRCRR